MDELGRVAVESRPECTIIRLPVQPPEFSLTRGTTSKRVLSWFVAAAGIAYLGGAIFLASELPHRPLRIPGPLALIVLCFGAAFFSFLILVAVAMAFGMFLAFFPTHLEIAVQRGQATLKLRRGYWRRTRRFKAIEALIVAPPARIFSRWLGAALERKECRLVVKMSDERHAVVLSRALYPLCREVGGAISAELGRHAAAPGPALIDQVDQQARNMDRPTAPRGADYLTERVDGTTTIAMPPPTRVFGQLLRDGVFRSGIWMILLPYPLFMGAFRLDPETTDPLRRILLPVVGGFAAIGLMFMVLAWYARVLRVRYVIDGKRLVKVLDLPLWKRRRHWDRDQIAAIRVGQRRGDEGRTRNVLEMLLKSGDTVVLEDGAIDRLQHVATLLRRELEVPAEIEPSALDEEQATMPKDCPFAIRQGPGWLEAAKAPQGLTGTLPFAFITGIVLVTAAGAGAIVAHRRLSGADYRAAILAALVFGGPSGILMLAAIWQASIEYRLRLDKAGGLAFWQHSAFGTRVFNLPLEEIAGIKAEAELPDRPRSAVAVIVLHAPERRTKLVSGEAKSMRYLAAALNRTHQEIGGILQARIADVDDR